MHNRRFRLMAGLAGATLCLFAVTSSAQQPTTTTGAPDPSAQTTTPATPAPTADAAAPTTGTDITTTETTTWSFPGGIWGILAASALVLFILFALFRGRDTRDTTVVRDTYVAPSTGARNAGTGTGMGDRNLNPRAASGTEPPRSGGINDPNTRV